MCACSEILNFRFWLGISTFNRISNFDFKLSILILNFEFQFWIWKLKVVWLIGRSISLSTENFVCCNRNAILACYIGLYIIFFITQINRVRFVSVNGIASRVKPAKNKFWKQVRKKFWEKNFEKKILKKNFAKKILKKPWEKVLIKKNVEK